LAQLLLRGVGIGGGGVGGLCDFGGATAGEEDGEKKNEMCKN
jgi:hypothetical protein